MIPRPYWLAHIHRAWEKASVAWLTGVRRVGKTTLAKALPEAEYLNCDLPSPARRLEDPEAFYRSLRSPRVVFDEIHQLPDPSRLLKIGADEHPKLRILATASSTLAATKKFKDSLSGRKRVIHLLPVLAEELEAFGIVDLRVRLLRGGLPQVLLASEPDVEFYGEWLDSFFARDIQELFRVEKRSGFLKLFELLLLQSGGLFEISSLAKHTGLSRPTVMNYIDALEATHVVRLLRPYHAGGRREILAQPKAYGFDTGFVAYARGWKELRPEDCGQLWEHLVLETLCSLEAVGTIHFWRDKQGREVDFVVPRARGTCDAFECKWSADSFEATGLKAFRENYPRGRNILVAPQVGSPYSRNVKGLEITCAHAKDLRESMSR